MADIPAIALIAMGLFLISVSYIYHNKRLGQITSSQSVTSKMKNEPTSVPSIEPTITPTPVPVIEPSPEEQIIPFIPQPVTPETIMSMTPETLLMNVISSPVEEYGGADSNAIISNMMETGGIAQFRLNALSSIINVFLSPSERDTCYPNPTTTMEKVVNYVTNIRMVYRKDVNINDMNIVYMYASFYIAQNNIYILYRMNNNLDRAYPHQASVFTKQIGRTYTNYIDGTIVWLVIFEVYNIYRKLEDSSTVVSIPEDKKDWIRAQKARYTTVFNVIGRFRGETGLTTYELPLEDFAIACTILVINTKYNSPEPLCVTK